MTTVSLVVNLPGIPDQPTAKQVMARFQTELLEMYLEAKGLAPAENVLSGYRLIVLGFPPGEFAPSKAGIVRDRTAFESVGGGSVPYAFAISDDPAAEQSPYSLWVMNIEDA